MRVKRFAQQPANNVSQQTQQRPGQKKKACPLHLSDALGTLLPVSRALCALERQLGRYATHCPQGMPLAGNGKLRL